jgi:hypothetical protein
VLVPELVGVEVFDQEVTEAKVLLGLLGEAEIVVLVTIVLLEKVESVVLVTLVLPEEAELVVLVTIFVAGAVTDLVQNPPKTALKLSGYAVPSYDYSS